MQFHSNLKLSSKKSFKMNKANYCFLNNLSLCSAIHLVPGHVLLFQSCSKKKKPTSNQKNKKIKNLKNKQAKTKTSHTHARTHTHTKKKSPPRGEEWS